MKSVSKSLTLSGTTQPGNAGEILGNNFDISMPAPDARTQVASNGMVGNAVTTAEILRPDPYSQVGRYMNKDGGEGLVSVIDPVSGKTVWIPPAMSKDGKHWLWEDGTIAGDTIAGTV
jgi:hypothetical protein